MLIVSTGVTLAGSKRLIRSLLGLVLFLGVVAYDARAQEHSEYAAADVAAGARVYGSMCASCHGVNGAGIGGIDLRRGPLRRAGTDAGLREVVTTGIQGTGMPGFRLEPDELRGLVAFVRVGLDATANGPTVVLGDPGRGRAVLEGDGQCLTCHRVGDKGAYVGPDLTEIGRTRTPVAIRRSLARPDRIHASYQPARGGHHEQRPRHSRTAAQRGFVHGAAAGRSGSSRVAGQVRPSQVDDIDHVAHARLR